MRAEQGHVSDAVISVGFLDLSTAERFTVNTSTLSVSRMWILFMVT